MKRRIGVLTRENRNADGLRLGIQTRRGSTDTSRTASCASPLHGGNQRVSITVSEDGSRDRPLCQRYIPPIFTWKEEGHEKTTIAA